MRIRSVLLAVLTVVALLPATALAQDSWSDPFPGVRRLHRRTSNQDIQVLQVDLCAAGVSVRATGSGEGRRTPSSFAALVGAQAAVNGDFFNGSYVPDGVSMSGGVAWGGSDHGYVAPIAFGDRRVSMAVHEAGGAPEPWMREVVSGHPTILTGGAVRGSDDPLCTNRHPRTALGLSADRRTLFVVVVDGRASTRIGMRCDELAVMLRDLGAHDVTNLDGGGSSAMWLQGPGVVNHPSDGTQRVVGNHLAIHATGSGPGAHCPDRAPEGYLDGVSCERIHGWSRDTDAPRTSIGVHVYVGGPAGDPAAAGYSIRADRSRDDLCAALGHCEHAYEMLVPHGFMDGVERPVFAYGIDATGGDNAQLASAPQMLRCDRPALAYEPATGVLRHITSREIFDAWRFDWNDIITLTDAELAAYEHGEPLPTAPRLVRTESDPRVFVQDGALRRHVTSPAVMDVWKFAWDAFELLDPATLDELEDGAVLAPRPWLVRGSGPEVYLLDAAPPRAPVPDAGAVIPGDGSVPSARTDAGRAGGSDAGVRTGLGDGCSIAHRSGTSPGSLAAVAVLLALAVVRRRAQSRRT